MLGYTFRYQVFVYSCHSCLLSSFNLLFSYPLVICWSYYLVILYLQLSYYYLVHIVYMHELSPLHTLTRSLSDDPGFVRPDIGRFVSIAQVFDETVRFAKSWIFSLFDFGILIFLVFILFPDSRYIRFSRYSSSWFIWYHAWMLICDIAVIMIYYN